MSNKNNSLFELIYNKANNINVKNLSIEDMISVSFLDALKNKTVSVKVNQQEKCECLKSEHVSSFYIPCDKCDEKGFLNVDNNKVVCNRCFGKGMLIKDLCPLCHGDLFRLVKKDLRVTLNGENNLVIKDKGLNINGEVGDLFLKVNVYDKDSYIIKGKDVYSKKIIYFKKNEFDRNKEVETCIDFTKFKLKEVKYEDVIKLEGKGIGGGDFYQPVRCEVKGEKGKDVYKNVILSSKKEAFFIKKEELYSSSLLLNVYDYKPLNDENYEYVKLDSYSSYGTVKLENKGLKGKNNGDNGDLYLQIFVGDFFVKNNDIYLSKCELSKTEMSQSKKNIVVNGTKISVPFDKKKNSNYFLDMGNNGLLLGKDKKSKLFIRIPVKNEEEYYITISNCDKCYVCDYKKFFNEEVKTYKTNNNLENYIYFDGNKEVYDSFNNKVNISLKKGGN